MREALASLRARRGRMLLALLGIAIGTGSVIAMLHVGSMARSEALRQFEGLGADLIAVTLESETDKPVRPDAFGFSLSEIERLIDLRLGLERTAPYIGTSASLRLSGRMTGVALLAVSDAWYPLLQVRVIRGRATSFLDERQAFAVIGAEIAKILRQEGQAELGYLLRIDDLYLPIIGELAPASANLLLGVDLDRAILIPLEAASRFHRDPPIVQFVAKLAPEVLMRGEDRKVILAVQQALAAPERPAIRVQTARQLIESVQEQMNIYTLLLVALGGISLIVGGFGVMNVMLMAVLERRREVGLRRAVGARQVDILWMFLTEALLLSTLGALGGIGLGVLVGWGISIANEWVFAFHPFAIPSALAMTTIAGLFFGSYPAYQASRLDPAVALRSGL